MRNNVEERYFCWLCRIVSKNERKYDDLLNALYNVKFIAEYPMDENRIGDGDDLRFRFGDTEGYSDSELNNIHNYCSVLEMIIALAIRMEEDIMSDLMYGDRTGQWFWTMIHNLGLGRMTNSKFNQRRFNTIIDDFIHHRYETDGHGGLFVVDTDYDLSKEEIWTQMNWYLNQLEE